MLAHVMAECKGCCATFAVTSRAARRAQALIRQQHRQLTGNCREATLPRMHRAEDPAVTSQSQPDGQPVVPAASAKNLADLPVAGLTRRRAGLIIGAVVAAWVVLLFAHQVGQASEAVARVQVLQQANVARQATVASLQGELDVVQKSAYVQQQARGYRLGGANEIPFTLAPDAPPLASDAPGSAGLHAGAPTQRPSPLESWLRLLFGPGGDPADAVGAGG